MITAVVYKVLFVVVVCMNVKSVRAEDDIDGYLLFFGQSYFFTYCLHLGENKQSNSFHFTK